MIPRCLIVLLPSLAVTQCFQFSVFGASKAPFVRHYAPAFWSTKRTPTTTLFETEESYLMEKDELVLEDSKTSFFDLLDNVGLSLKPRAIRYKNRALEGSTSPVQKFRWIAKASVLFSLFTLYRAYRGFFVILPAVFREVYRQLGDAVETTPFEDSKVTTTVTVSLLATVLTLSYVVGGGMRVLLRFLRTFLVTNCVPGSFEAAANEMVNNEAKMMRLTDDGIIDGRSVNGGSGRKAPEWD